MSLSSLFAAVATCRAVLAQRAVAVGLLVAACAAPQPLPPPPDIPHGQGRIWQVERPGGLPSYVFGTMHATDPRVFELPQPAQTAFLDAATALSVSDYRRSASRTELRTYTDLHNSQTHKDKID